MKKSILNWVIGFLLISLNAFAGNGDLVVDGKVGIGPTNSAPALLTLNGANTSVSGPHIRVFTDADAAYPVLENLNWRHDNLSLSFDAFYNGAWTSSSSLSNFSIMKLNGALRFKTANNIAAGNPITWTEMMTLLPSGNVGIGTATPSHLFSVGANGAGSDGAAWYTSSSREYKNNIQELSAERAREAVKNMKPVTFDYKDIPGYNHVGFIAEDVPDLIATPDRKSLSAMDIVAVLTKVLQEQQEEIEKLKSDMKMMKAKDTGKAEK